MNKPPRPRPAILRALGRADPPDEVQAGTRKYHLLEVFKHDAWAATALYGSGESKIVVKFNRRAPVVCIPMGWLGNWLASREASAYKRLRGVPGIPRACGAVEADGRLCSNAFAHDFVTGHPLAKNEFPGEQFLDALKELLSTLHARDLAYLDLNKRENIIVTDQGHPLLVDFQIHFAPPRWLSRLGPVKWAMRQLQAGDRYHLLKLRIFHTLGPDAAANIPVPRSSRIWRSIYVHPVQGLRRRLLVFLGVRRGEGLAHSELNPEKAVRLHREPANATIKRSQE